MSGDFWLIDVDGMPETFIDADRLSGQARDIIAQLLVNARDGDAVAMIISERVMALDAPENVKLLLAVTIIDNLVGGVMGAALDAAAAVTSGLHLQPGPNRASRAPQPGDTSPDSE